jgi:tetratricopeptide (TPR) repeat protein
LGFSISSDVKGQSPAQFMRQGDLAAEQKNWNLAFSYYEAGYLLDTASFEMAVKYAEAARLIRNYKLAERLYERNYEKDNGKLQPDGLYWLAYMQKHNGRYEDAQRNFKKYIKKYKSSGNRELLKRAEQEIKSAVWALDYKEKPSPDVFSHPENEPNSVHPEIAPFVLEDRLIFTSSRKNEFGDFWEVYVKDHSGEIRKLNLVSIPQGAAVGNFKQVSNDFWLFSLMLNGATKIYSAQLAGDRFSDVKEVISLNQEGMINTMPCPAFMGDYLYVFFVSDREGGEGGKDIWYTKTKKPSPKTLIELPELEKVNNLGGRYNTPGDELSPFYFQNKFYYSSDWLEGFGGLDIFEVDVKEFLVSSPANMGKPINSSAQDFYFVRNENEGWLSSNREGSIVLDTNATCCHDLYRIVYHVEEDHQLDSLEASQSVNLKGLNNKLPVILYFHNDEPVPDSWDTTTTLSYTDAYDSYLQKIPTYLKENTRGLSGERKEEVETMTLDFFDLKVKEGFNDLNEFSDLLLRELQKGRSLNVSVRGFASPRAQTDYNLNLTKRRTSSLVNYLRADSSGIFLPYIDDMAENGARLTFTLLPFGEVKADKSVSDDLNDQKNSIYSRSACLERKIEIESVNEILPTPKKVELKMEMDSFSFGKIPKLGNVQRSLKIFNEGNSPMVIDSVLAECGCTDPKLDKHIVLPGEYATMEITFTPFGYKGHVVKHVMLYIAGEEPRMITFEAEVEK